MATGHGLDRSDEQEFLLLAAGARLSSRATDPPTLVVGADRDPVELALAVLADQPASALTEQDVLAFLVAAQRALTEAATIVVAREILSQAEAIGVYARKWHLARDVRNRAAVLCLDAERKVGQLLGEMAERGERHPQGRTSEVAARNFTPPTLAELGITRTEAHRCGQVADVPLELYDGYLADASARGDAPSRAGLLRCAEAGRVPEPWLDVLPKISSKPTISIAPGDLLALGGHRILCGDSRDPKHLARLMADETAALMASDPPTS